MQFAFVAYLIENRWNYVKESFVFTSKKVSFIHETMYFWNTTICKQVKCTLKLWEKTNTSCIVFFKEYSICILDKVRYL